LKCATCGGLEAGIAVLNYQLSGRDRDRMRSLANLDRLAGVLAAVTIGVTECGRGPGSPCSLGGLL
jgi:hypothetical protein